MCNLYSLTKGQQAIREFTRAMRDNVGNLPPMPGIFPDYSAPIVRTAVDGVREITSARWGMPSSQKALMEATRKRAHRLQSKGKDVDFKPKFPGLKLDWLEDFGGAAMRSSISPAALHAKM